MIVELSPEARSKEGVSETKDGLPLRCSRGSQAQSSWKKILKSLRVQDLPSHPGTSCVKPGIFSRLDEAMKSCSFGSCLDRINLVVLNRSVDFSIANALQICSVGFACVVFCRFIGSGTSLSPLLADMSSRKVLLHDLHKRVSGGWEKEQELDLHERQDPWRHCSPAIRRSSFLRLRNRA